MDTIIAQVIRSFPAPSGWNGQIVVTAKLYSLGGQKPYFSVTAAIGTAWEVQTGNWQAGGCLHEEILKVWPAVKPLVDLHLLDEDGAPMHAEANGWYWIAKAAGIKQPYEPEQSPEECLRIGARHLRISMEDAERLVINVLASEEPRKFFASFVAAQAPRWAAEAADGLALIRAFAAAQKESRAA